MKVIVVIYRWGLAGSSFLQSITESFSSAFKNLGLDIEHYRDSDIPSDIDFSNSILIILTKPNKFADAVQSILKNKKHNNTKIICYSMEPIFFKHQRKHDARAQYYLKIIEDANNGIDYFWDFDIRQADWVNKKLKVDNYLYVPFGFDKSLMSNNNKKTKSCLFVGEKFGGRVAMLGLLPMKVEFIQGKDKISYDNLKKKLSEYKIGIDIIHNRLTEDYVRWHRIMLYAANECVILSDSNLDRFGILNGKHYFKCSSQQEFKSKVACVLGDEKIRIDVVNNMNNFLQTFKMSDIFKDALQKSKILV